MPPAGPSSGRVQTVQWVLQTDRQTDRPNFTSQAVVTSGKHLHLSEIGVLICKWAASQALSKGLQNHA